MTLGPQVMTPYCGALIDCHMTFSGRWISLTSYCSCNGVKLASATLLYLPFSSFDTPAPTPWCRSLQLFTTVLSESCRKTFSHHLSWHQLDFFPPYLQEGLGKSLYYWDYKGCIQSDWDFSLKSSSSQSAFEIYFQKPQRIPDWHHLHTWLHSLHQVWPSVENSARSQIPLPYWNWSYSYGAATAAVLEHKYPSFKEGNVTV